MCSVAVLLCSCVGGFIWGIYFVIICSSSLLLLTAVLRDCGISWVSSLICFIRRFLYE